MNFDSVLLIEQNLHLIIMYIYDEEEEGVTSLTEHLEDVTIINA